MMALHRAVSLDNVLSDVREMQRGMELTWREFSVHGHNATLKDFISRHEARLTKLQEDARIAQVLHAHCARCTLQTHTVATHCTLQTHTVATHCTLQTHAALCRHTL